VASRSCYECDSTQGSRTRLRDGRMVCDNCLDGYLYDLGMYEPGPEVHGKATSRFSKRLVGVEIETGDGATAGKFVREYIRSMRTWAYKEDGSLNDGGMELVSPPVSGGAIPLHINKVYRLLKKHGVDMTDDSAGCHIHVDMRDVFSHIKAKPASVQFISQWGDLLVDVVRRMVDSDRAENCYCSDSFGYRNGSDRKEFLPKSLPFGDAAVALRVNTMEFRIWSIADRPDLTLARAEFCQRVVDYLDKTIQGDTLSGFKEWKDAATHLRLRANFKPLAKLLGLSPKTVKEFSEFSEHRSMEILELALEEVG